MNFITDAAATGLLLQIARVRFNEAAVVNTLFQVSVSRGSNRETDVDVSPSLPEAPALFDVTFADIAW